MARTKPKPYLRVLGQRVAAFRAEMHLKQAELADRAGVTNKYISQVERGLANVSLDVLWRISGVLGVSLAQLFTAPDDADVEIAQLLRGRSPVERRRAIKLIRALLDPID